MGRFLVISSLSLALSACGVFDGQPDEVVFDTTLGPETDIQIRQLPNDLSAPDQKPPYRGQGKGEDLEGDGL